MQISIWSRSQSEGVIIRDALRRLLDGYAGMAGEVQIDCAFLMAGRYGFDDVTGQHHFSQDFKSITANESVGFLHHAHTGQAVHGATLD